MASPIGGASSGFERYAAPCVRALAPLIAEAEALSSLGLSRSLLENIASTLGRVCLVCPHETAPLFGEFARPWCLALALIVDAAEKRHSSRALCLLTNLNPAAVLPCFEVLCLTIATWSPEHQSTALGTLAEHHRDNGGGGGPGGAATRHAVPNMLVPLPSDIQRSFHLILHSFKKTFAEHWGALVARFHPDMWRYLSTVYDL